MDLNGQNAGIFNRYMAQKSKSQQAFVKFLCLQTIKSSEKRLWFSYNNFRYIKNVLLNWGRWWHSRLRHCATSQEVTGLIPDGVTGIFIGKILPAKLSPWSQLSHKQK
jgi:hypothetical protein